MDESNSPEGRWHEFLKRNQTLVDSKTYKPPNTMIEIDHFNQSSGNKYLYIITCADSRVHPEEIFGMKKQEAIIIKVGGGRVVSEGPDVYRGEVFRSLGVMTGIAPAGLIIVLHHKDCGGLHRTDAKVKEILSRRNPSAAKTVENFVYGTFGDIGIDESIRRDVQKLREWPFIGDAKVLGYVFDEKDGSVSKVC